MQDNTKVPAYVVEFRGLKVQCDDVEHVVEAVKALAPLEREVPVPVHTETEAHTVVANDVAVAVEALLSDGVPRRPVEIVRALKRQRVPRAKYTTVYAALRYGNFAKQNGRWSAAA